jgi:hypothetical protein
VAGEGAAFGVWAVTDHESVTAISKTMPGSNEFRMRLLLDEAERVDFRRSGDPPKMDFISARLARNDENAIQIMAPSDSYLFTCRKDGDPEGI